MRLTRRDRLVLFAPLAVLLSGWLVLPALLGLLATFSTYSPFSTSIHFAGLGNYLAVIRDPQFGVAIRNITLFAVSAVPLELVIGFGLAYLLRRPIRGRGLWRLRLLLPSLVRPISNGVLWRFLLIGATARAAVYRSVQCLPAKSWPAGAASAWLIAAAVFAVGLVYIRLVRRPATA